MKHILLLTSFLATMVLPAQRLTIVIDPARGGTEYGARIGEHDYEKQITLDLANRLRSLLTARDFDVVLTRENDVLVSNDQRATVANQAKPLACLLLHSTNSGSGVHLFTSSLTPSAPVSTGVLWDEAQAPYVQRSQRLQTELATAFSRSRLPVSSGRTWIRPLDNMQCPAVAIEVAAESKSTDATDRAYQTRIADAIANSLLLWRGHTDVVQSIVAPPRETPAPAQPVAGKALPASPEGSAQKTAPADAKPTSAGPTPSSAAIKPPVRKTAPVVKATPAASSPEAEGAKPE